jgi:hypothetical protein
MPSTFHHLSAILAGVCQMLYKFCNGEELKAIKLDGMLISPGAKVTVPVSCGRLKQVPSIELNVTSALVSQMMNVS